MIKLLIVDDSALMRRLLIGLFTAAGDFVIEAARDGHEAIARLTHFAPHVITLDVNMPNMGGLACLDRIMLDRPTPVVMVSSLTTDGAEDTLEAMALGAVDFIAKPTGALSVEIEALAPLLIEKVRAAAHARMPQSRRLAERLRSKSATVRPSDSRRGHAASASPRAPGSILGDGLVLIGCSTGGPPALETLLGGLSADFPWPILVAQHMPASFTGPLARRLDKACGLSISEVTRIAPLMPGHAYIGRGDADMVVARRQSGLVAMAAPSSPDHNWHPSVDRLVGSAMEHVAPKQLVGVLMTGMGSDGAKRMGELHDNGGYTIAEAEETAVIWGMPGSLVALGGANVTVPVHMIALTLTLLIGVR